MSAHQSEISKSTWHQKKFSFISLLLAQTLPRLVFQLNLKQVKNHPGNICNGNYRQWSEHFGGPEIFSCNRNVDADKSGKWAWQKKGLYYAYDSCSSWLSKFQHISMELLPTLREQEHWKRTPPIRSHSILATSLKYCKIISCIKWYCIQRGTCIFRLLQLVLSKPNSMEPLWAT